MEKTLDIALVQACTPADQAAALAHIRPLVIQAATGGAELILTPECSNMVEARGTLRAEKVVSEDADVFVQGIRELARQFRTPILIGSAIVASGPKSTHEKAANRSLFIDAAGNIVARYDKIHLFDADTPDGKSYRESAAFTPGDKAVVAETAWGGLGLTICYDMRFAYLYRMIARRGADMIAVPAAFTVPTGRAHWEVLLRARAIETGAFVVAPAQGGLHEDGRTTYGHSLVAGPWGEVIARLDHDHPAVLTATLDFSEVARARQALPQLRHDREIGAGEPS